MGMTLTEKILSRHAGLDEVRPGMLINAKVDIALGNDITAPIAIDEFRKAGGKEVFDKQKVVLVPDHFAPNKDIDSAEQCKLMRDFAHEQAITHSFEIGEAGVEHALLPEKGIVVPGDVIIGADSHTCTYGALGAFSTGMGSTDLAFAMITGGNWFKVPESIKVILSGKPGKDTTGKDIILEIIRMIGVDGALYRTLEFTGSTIPYLTMDDRFSMCNMAIEAGAKSGIVAYDEITAEFLADKPLAREPKIHTSDEDATYVQVLEIDVASLEPVIAYPFLPSNGHSLTQAVSDNIKIDQAFIGSCTNGRLSDLKIAAEILKGKRVHPDVRLIVTPGTQRIVREATRAGYIDIIIDAGGVVSNPTCGACLGGYMGILGDNEVAVATTNRNFVGRMGSRSSKVYLANSAVAAASAITGYITDPSTID